MPEEKDEKRYSQGELDILVAINRLESEVALLRRNEAKYLLRAEFEIKFDPIQKLVYGMVGLILVAFVGGVIALVLQP